MADEKGMISGRPLPEPDEWSREFWDACREERLVMQRCVDCERLRYTPRPMCPYCRSFARDTVPVSGRGTIYSWIVVRPPVMPAFQDRVPMAVVLVELEEDPELRMVGNLLDFPIEEIDFGVPVEVCFERVTDEVTLPQWRRRKA